MHPAPVRVLRPSEGRTVWRRRSALTEHTEFEETPIYDAVREALGDPGLSIDQAEEPIESVPSWWPDSKPA